MGSAIRFHLMDKAKQSIVIKLFDGIKFVVMATRTPDRGSKEYGSYGGEHVIQHVVIRLQGIIGFIIVNMKSVKASCDQCRCSSGCHRRV